MNAVTFHSGRAERIASRAQLSLAVLRECPALLHAVLADVDAFFSAHPADPRDGLAAAWITVLAFERVAHAAGLPELSPFPKNQP